MALEFSSVDLSCLNGPPALPYRFNPEDYSLTEAMAFDDHFTNFRNDLDPFDQLPVDLGKSSMKNSVTRTSDSQSRQDINAVRTNSIYHTNLQLDDLDIERSPVAINRNLDRGPTSEETARKRREQNRASQRKYRARRDKHVEELEQRNQFLQRHASALLEENQRLKLQLLQLPSAQNSLTEDSTTPLGVSPAPSTIISSSPPVIQHDREYLDVKEIWDLIQDHWLYKCGHVRIEDIYHRLKNDADSISLDRTKKRVDVLKAIQSCSIGRHYDLL